MDECNEESPVWVKFLPGDGTEQVIVVKYIASDYARGPHGLCAFCHGDPLGYGQAPGTMIKRYHRRNPDAGTCPMCKGRST